MLTSPRRLLYKGLQLKLNIDTGGSGRGGGGGEELESKAKLSNFPRVLAMIAAVTICHESRMVVEQFRTRSEGHRVDSFWKDSDFFLFLF